MNKLKIEFEKAVPQFEKALKKFQVRKTIYRSVFRGKGLEFDGYRKFDESDDASMIDWKASLRAGNMLAKQYIEERNLNIYFFIDSSNSMLFGSGKKLKAEYAGEIILSLARLIMNSGDNAGLIMFADKAIKIIQPSRNKNQFFLFLKYLSEPEAYRQRFDFKSALDYSVQNIEKDSVVIFLSDFLQYRGNLEKELKLAGLKFDCIAFMIRDVLDDKLPKAGFPIVVQDPASSRQIVVDSAFASKSYERNAFEQKAQVKNNLENAGMNFLELNTSESFVSPIIALLKSQAGGKK